MSSNSKPSSCEALELVGETLFAPVVEIHRVVEAQHVTAFFQIPLFDAVGYAGEQFVFDPQILFGAGQGEHPGDEVARHLEPASASRIERLKRVVAEEGVHPHVEAALPERVGVAVAAEPARCSEFGVTRIYAEFHFLYRTFR